MGQRRKGEQPVPREVEEWSEEHPVARWLRDGDHWFEAWTGQMATSYDRLRKLTGIPLERIEEIDAGANITRAEIEALEMAWSITPEGLIASLPDPTIVVS